MKKLCIVILSVVLASACGGSAVNTNAPANVNTSNAAPAANTNAAPAGYPEETREAFLASCENAGSNREFCTCVLEKVEAKYSFEEFSAIEDQIQDGEPSQEFIEFSTKARAECEK